MSSPSPYRMAFVMDQQVGLRTQALNLRRVVETDAEIAPTWIPVDYKADAGPLTRLPGIPGGIKGTLRGIREIRSGFTASPDPFDAVLWATWAAKSVPKLVGRAPAFLRMDMTPTQMEAMGAQYGYSRGRARFLGRAKRRATDRLYALATHHFPWSGYVADSLRSDYGVPTDKITVVSPGVDTDLYRPDPSAKAGDGVVRILFVGGHFDRKGGDLLLRWANDRRESKTVPPFELQVVTRDEAVQSAPGLVIHRHVANNSPELVRLYQSCDLFVLPTRADCYSLVALEAMASGLPVVISRIGGIPDIVADGETGFLLPPEDYDALASALDRLVADAALRDGMGASARGRAEAHFDSRRCLGGMLAAMKGMAAR